MDNNKIKNYYRNIDHIAHFVNNKKSKYVFDFNPKLFSAKQTKDNCLIAIRHNPKLLIHIKNKTPEICLAAEKR